MHSHMAFFEGFYGDARNSRGLIDACRSTPDAALRRVIERYDLHMTTHNFRVPNFPIRGCSFTKRQITSIVRKVIRESGAQPVAKSLRGEGENCVKPHFSAPRPFDTRDAPEK